MKKAKEYLIPFVGLKLGKHHFEFDIDNKFFEIFDYHEFKTSDIKVNVVLEKTTTMLELNFSNQGTVVVPCDLSGDDFDLPLKGNLKLIVRFGEKFNNDNEELLILPFGEFEIEVSQYIYEMIVLSVPLRRVSQKIIDQETQARITDEENISALEKKEEKTDPRWDKLKQLLTDK